MSIVDGVVTVLPAPDGYTVDFANQQRTGKTAAYWVVGVGNFLAFFFLLQRIYVKVRISRNFVLDDALLILAWACSVAVQAITTRMFVMVFCAPVIYAPGTCFAKLSLFLFYKRISPQTWFQWANNAMIFITIGYTIGIFFSLLFACNPIERAWTITITTGSCINRPALYIATAIIGIVTDVILLVMPVGVIVGLQMHVRQKLALLGLFAVGSLTLVTSIVRLTTLIPILDDTDQTWAITYPEIWICVEANLLVICASIATAQKFFHHIQTVLFSNNLNSDAKDEQQPADLPSGKGPRTFGARSTKRTTRYNNLRFEDTAYAMQTLEGEKNFKQRPLRPDLETVGREVQIGHAPAGSEGRVSLSDGGSETHIVQTTTFSMQFDKSEPGEVAGRQ